MTPSAAKLYIEECQRFDRLQKLEAFLTLVKEKQVIDSEVKQAIERLAS